MPLSPPYVLFFLTAHETTLPCRLPPRYGFLLRVKAMGMGSSIERRRKIQAYWASLVDQANSYDDDVGADDS